ncbi:maker541 [Drosophila busckii]|uniref:Maker541 n=1 Tax=Drosophila busckii TaxID=30019 RepID=A0A0M4EDF3_DROBS|nr:maker541 [Drosophila busckii]
MALASCKERFHKQEIAYKEQQTKLAEQQEALKKSDELKDSLISEKDKRIENLDKKLEASVEAQKETLKKNEQLQAKVNELQTKIKVQQEDLKKSEELKNSLLSEKDKRIADLKEQMNNMNKNKQFEDKLIKFVDRAEATSCVPFDNSNDIQTIRVTGIEAFKVPCDSMFAGNGWTVIQRRVDDSVSFNRTWEEYKNGFGDLRGNFWLGLEKLHLMTKFQPHELYIQLEDFKNEKRYARYTNFIIGNETQSYLLNYDKYSGNAGKYDKYSGDSLSDAKNRKFSTPERDNDKFDRGNCAADTASGWWFNKCYYCNLNGVYVNTIIDEEHIRAIEWRKWHIKPLKFVQMMIRPTNN